MSCEQVHLPAFAGSMSPSAGSSTSTSSQPEQRQTKKWASVLMAHYKSGVASSNWQSGPSNSPLVFHQPQILFSPSRSSVEAIGSKYAPTIQQQQRVSASTALLPPSAIKGQYHHHHLPSIYEGNVGGTHPAYADNMQSAYLRC